METRVLGRTGHKSTIIALGGALFIGNPPRREVDALIQTALDHGVNHIDVAPTYGDAELGLGKWVKEYRKNVFLACKTMERTRKDAAKELRRSLERLQTDHFDLYQLHQVDKLEELETILGPDGAMEAILEARGQGLVKHVGITSHNPLLLTKALECFNFDTVLLPVNCVLRAHRQPENDYEPVLALAKKRGVAVMAMKAIAKGPWPDEKKRPYNTWYQPFDAQKEIDEALWFTLSQDVITATSSSDVLLTSMMIDAAERFKPMSNEEQVALISRVSSHRPLFPADFIP
jgi:aryl-alcohol dehydrogenase-like predicted oxidoreductase